MKHTMTLWVVIGALLAAVIAAALYRTWPLLFPPVAINVPADPTCDLRAGPCESALTDQARVSFEIQPHDIPLVKPLQLKVQVVGITPQQVEVDFSGVDMNMGFNRFKLTSSENGTYAGDGILPVCVRDAMEWEAKVLLTTPDGLVSVAYRFFTVRPGAELPTR